MKTFTHVALATLAWGAFGLAQASTASYAAGFTLNAGLPQLATGNPNVDGPGVLPGRWTSNSHINAEVKSRDLLGTSVDPVSGAVVQQWGQQNQAANPDHSAGPPFSMGQTFAQVTGPNDLSQTTGQASVYHQSIRTSVEQNGLLSQSSSHATWQRDFALDAHSSFTFSGIATLALGGQAGPLDTISQFTLGAGDSFASLTFGDVLGRVRTTIGASIASVQAGVGNIFSYSFGPDGLMSLTITNHGDTELRGALNAGSHVSVAAPVPEPETWASMLLGVALLGAAMRKRRVAAAA